MCASIKCPNVSQSCNVAEWIFFEIRVVTFFVIFTYNFCNRARLTLLLIITKSLQYYQKTCIENGCQIVTARKLFVETVKTDLEGENY